MRVLLVHTGTDLYGASRSLLRLATRLRADGVDVLVVLPEDGPLGLALRSNDVAVVVHRWMALLDRSRLRTLGGVVRLVAALPVSMIFFLRTIRRFRPDVAHTNTAICVSVGPAAKVYRVPHIWHVREFFADFPRLWPIYRGYMLSFADRVVCVSDAVAKQFPARTGSKPVVVCHNGFPRAEFEGVTEERVKGFRAAHRLGDDRLVGIVGRIKCGRKGQDVFVRAAARIAPRFPDVRFLIIGSPFPGNESHLDRVRAIVREASLQERVVFTGDVEDIKAAYAALSVSVLASAQPEPFGGVVIESMAMGVPVVGTRIGGTPEQINHGVTGLLVEPDDPAGLAAALTTLLGEPRKLDSMGVEARRSFLERFEFEAFYERLSYEYAAVGGPVSTR